VTEGLLIIVNELSLEEIKEVHIISGDTYFNWCKLPNI